MSVKYVNPNSDGVAVGNHQKVSWKIRKEDLDEGEGDMLVLFLSSDIPGTIDTILGIGKYGIIFSTFWPKDVDLDLINLHAEYSVRTNDGKCAATIKGGSERIGGYNHVSIKKTVTINADLLYDEDWSFTLEADLHVEMQKNEAEKSSLNKPRSVGEDIRSIFNEEKSSDVLVIARGQEFKCHKAILGARSEVFKNTLGHNTIECETNTIVIKETTAQAVEDMLKYIYSGDIPDNPSSLTSDLLHISDMYLLQPVVDACLKNLVESLDVSSCISTFMLLDRYMPQDRNLREMVIKFIQCNATEVVEMEDWDKLLDSNRALAKELMRDIAGRTKEKHKCQFCVVTYITNKDD